jgi:hypothetical protein
MCAAAQHATRSGAPGGNERRFAFRRHRGSSAALLRLSQDSLVRETGLLVVDSESLRISENSIFPRRSTTLKILPPSSNTDTKASFRKCTVRPPSTRSRAKPQGHMMAGRFSLATKFQPLTSCGPSWHTSRPCTAPSAPIATLITAGTLIPSKAQPEVTKCIPRR